MTDDDDILAAEFALGLLDDAGAQAVQRRARADAVLSLRIAWWRDQLAPLAGEVETPVPAGIWQRIETQLPDNDNTVPLMQRWRATAIGAMGVAAALLVFIGVRSPAPAPTPVAAVTVSPMVAALAGDQGAIVAISYDSSSGALTVAPTTLDPGRGDAELWVIPAGGDPVSLGVVDSRLPQVHNISGNRRALVLPGATFAITQEGKGGSPDGKPHGPIAASGKIIRA